jgi:hypothetical protein
MDYFSMSATMCLEVGWQFDNVVANLYMEEYLHIPDGKDLKRICQLHKDAHGVDGMVGHTRIGKIVPRHGKDRSKEKKGSLWWFWRHSATTTCSFGMLPMVMLVA